MSRQTGECFAEVTFETHTRRFRCHWSHHRARKKPSGDLQSPKHEIADADSGEILEFKITGVADQVEEATGMDFERFTRSMLLAQGGFAAFLQAAPDERAPILEQITGTEIYSQISIRVHERQREERDKLNLLQAETAGIVILEPEQEKEIQQALESKQKEEIEISANHNATEKAISWLTVVDGLKKEIIALSDEADNLQSDIDAFKPDRYKLGQAKKAATLDSLYATLTAIRKQQTDDQEERKAKAEILPELEFSAKKQAESLELAERQAVEVKEELKTAASLIQKVRSLDQKLADQEKAVSESEESCQKDAANIFADTQNRLEEQIKRSEAQKTLELVDGYLKKHAEDEWLISGLAGVEEQLNGLHSKQNDIAQKEADQKKAVTALERAKKSLDDWQKQCSTRKRELDDASNSLQQGKDELSRLLGGRLLREYRSDKEDLLRDTTSLAEIAELEEHRLRLEDGKACPLCGATEHPFAEGNIPVPDEAEQKIETLTKLISKAENQEDAINKLKESEVAARNNLTEAEKQETAATNDKKNAKKTLAEAKEGMEKLQTDFIEQKQAVSVKLLALGITEIPDTDVSLLLESLRERLNEWKSRLKEKDEIKKQIADLDSEIKRLDAVIETQSKSLAEQSERLESLKKEHTIGSDKRKELYGDRSPDDEESRLNKAVSDAEDTEKKARELHNELQQEWNTAKTHVELLEKSITQREPELRKPENEFSAKLRSVGFSDENQFLKARLPNWQKDEFSAKAQELDDRQTDLKARQGDRETRLHKEIARKVTDKSLEDLEPQFKEYKDALKKLRDIIAGFKHRLSENTAAKEQIKAKQSVIETQKSECRRWENLHELIGSSDGKKYRNFAQGLTFKTMIGHVNRQLEKMTDRYLLIRDDAQPLKLNVLDNYQAGEIRSTNNLSGGESFIVSLSLALGLAQMASRNVRVDSLFLDEGFGTLDEEALDTALETLGGLQQAGKLIGVISHVPALKERIGTQIQVTPQTGGRSQISGPGCSRLGAI